VNGLKFAAEEATLSLWRRRRSNILSLLTVTVAMLVLGGFLLVNVNVQRWIGQWSAAAELSVYLDDPITGDQRAELERMLAAESLVSGTEFVSSDEALRRFGRLFPELASAARSLGERPLPASIEVQLRRDAATDDGVAALAERVRTAPGVSDVRFDRRWLDRILKFVDAGRWAGVALAAVLVVAAALTVASVIRLALHARQQEVEIMHLVGAPLGFIRGPFVVEGVLQGGLGALGALAVLYAGFVVARMRVPDWFSGIAGLEAGFQFLPWTAVLGLVAGGMLVGCIGGLVASRSAS
jgi:cell division transport system permease protein